MKKLEIPKEDILPQLKDMMKKQLTTKMKEAGIKHFSMLDVEWTENGLIIHYNSSID